MDVPDDVVKAHEQTESKKYTIRFPDHAPRNEDPHYKAFEAWRKANVKDAKCYVSERIGAEHCKGGLELHHAHIEFAVANAVDINAVEKDFPDVNDEEALQKWVESASNFMWLCEFHHRGNGGAHTASHADWIAGLYVPTLFDE